MHIDTNWIKKIVESDNMKTTSNLRPNNSSQRPKLLAKSNEKDKNVNISKGPRKKSYNDTLKTSSTKSTFTKSPFIDQRNAIGQSKRPISKYKGVQGKKLPPGINFNRAQKDKTGSKLEGYEVRPDAIAPRARLSFINSIAESVDKTNNQDKANKKILAGESISDRFMKDSLVEENEIYDKGKSSVTRPRNEIQEMVWEITNLTEKCDTLLKKTQRKKKKLVTTRAKLQSVKEKKKIIKNEYRDYKSRATEEFKKHEVETERLKKESREKEKEKEEEIQRLNKESVDLQRRFQKISSPSPKILISDPALQQNGDNEDGPKIPFPSNLPNTSAESYEREMYKLKVEKDKVLKNNGIITEELQKYAKTVEEMTNNHKEESRSWEKEKYWFKITIEKQERLLADAISPDHEILKENLEELQRRNKQLSEKLSTKEIEISKLLNEHPQISTKKLEELNHILEETTKERDVLKQKVRMLILS